MANNARVQPPTNPRGPGYVPPILDNRDDSINRDDLEVDDQRRLARDNVVAESDSSSTLIYWLVALAVLAGVIYYLFAGPMTQRPTTTSATPAQTQSAPADTGSSAPVQAPSVAPGDNATTPPANGTATPPTHGTATPPADGSATPMNAAPKAN